MLEIKKSCDSCGNFVLTSENASSCWTATTLFRVFGVTRRAISVDLCPYCQDSIIALVNENRKKQGLSELSE